MQSQNAALILTPLLASQVKGGTQSLIQRRHLFRRQSSQVIGQRALQDAHERVAVDAAGTGQAILDVHRDLSRQPIMN